MHTILLISETLQLLSKNSYLCGCARRLSSGPSGFYRLPPFATELRTLNTAAVPFCPTLHLANAPACRLPHLLPARPSTSRVPDARERREPLVALIRMNVLVFLPGMPPGYRRGYGRTLFVVPNGNYRFPFIIVVSVNFNDYCWEYCVSGKRLMARYISE